MLVAINNRDKFFKLTAIEIKLLLILIDKNDEERNEVFLPKYIKQEIADMLGVKIQSIYNTLKSLKDKGIIEGRIDYCRISPDVIEKVELIDVKE